MVRCCFIRKVETILLILSQFLGSNQDSMGPGQGEGCPAPGTPVTAVLGDQEKGEYSGLNEAGAMVRTGIGHLLMTHSELRCPEGLFRGWDA